MRNVKVHLTDAQLRSLAKGKGVMAKPLKEGQTAYDIWCSEAKAKKLEKAMTKGKGMRLKLEPDEMDANEIEIEGGRINWKKIGRVLKSTAKAVGKVYREKVRPVVKEPLRKLVKEGIEKGIPLLVDAVAVAAGQPEIGAVIAPGVERLAKKVSEPATEKISKLTGAFGVKAKPKKTYRKSPVKTVAKQSEKMIASVPIPEPPVQATRYSPQLQNNYSNFLNPNHPAMNPTLPMIDHSLPLKGRGLYAQGNGLFVGGGSDFEMGSPMNPQLPMPDNSLAR